MNVGKILQDICEKKKNEEALIFENDIYTYSDIGEKVNRYANFFKAIGIEKGKKIAFYLPNCPEYIFSYLAIFKISATGVPLDHRLKITETFTLMNHSKAEYLITYSFKGLDLEKIKKNVPS